MYYGYCSCLVLTGSCPTVCNLYRNTHSKSFGEAGIQLTNNLALCNEQTAGSTLTREVVGEGNRKRHLKGKPHSHQ